MLDLHTGQYGVVRHMQTSTVTTQCFRERMSDWESPAGGESTRPRLARYTYTYRGPGSRHWLAQPCDILSSDNSADSHLHVVFACGCQTRAARDCIMRRPN